MNYKDAKDKVLNAIKDFCAPRARLRHYIATGNVEQIKKLGKRAKKGGANGGDHRRIVRSLKSPIYQALYSSNTEVLKAVLEYSATGSVVLYTIACAQGSIATAKKRECSVLEFNPIDCWLEKNVDDIIYGCEDPNFLPKYKVLREYFPISASARVEIDQYIAFTGVREWEEEYKEQIAVKQIHQQRSRILEKIEAPHLQKVRRM